MAGNADRLAFVIPWYGANILGGAELECRKTAEHLAAAGVPVEVLTTCAKDLFGGWTQDYHREGVTVENGVTVRRFALTKEPLIKFGEINHRLIANERVSREEEITFMRESVNSQRLYDYIRDHQQSLRLLFIPYLFGTTYYGAQIAPERSWIIPCLHDEGYARMRLFGSLFANARGLILHSPSERDLARELYALPDDKMLLWGEGVDTGGVGDADRFRAKYGVDGDYLLYVGRRDPSKNTPLLIEYFSRYVLSGKHPVKLLLAGNGAVRVPARFGGQIVDLGPISEQDKLDANAGALALCQPSVNESFSLVIMESWVQGTPVLVNAGCAATTGHALASSGGLPFGGFAEFAGCLDWLVEHPAQRRKMGELGRKYVLTNYHWDRIVERYGRLLG